MPRGKHTLPENDGKRRFGRLRKQQKKKHVEEGSMDDVEQYEVSALLRRYRQGLPAVEVSAEEEEVGSTSAKFEKFAEVELDVVELSS
jgi:hypothetical protein